MKNYTLCLFVLVFLTSNPIFSQENLKFTSKDSIVQSSWMIGLGYNFVDDSGDAFNDFTTIENQWNAVTFPSRISIGRYFKSGLGIEAIGTHNRYKKGNIIDGNVNPEDIDYFGLDTRLSYDLNKLIGETAWFDPYVGVGLGYTDANTIGRGTYNAVIGFRTWFSDRLALDLSSSGKWSFGNEATNHIQHAAGVVYQFNVEKGLSKKGVQKRSLIEEQQRLQDSLAAIDRAKEEAALAERLTQEKEKARLAAAEKAKREAQELQKQKIDELSKLNKVYYRFNSSYLTSSDKGKLDELVDFMNKYPNAIIEISGHADARGTAKYNNWLSERRAQNAVKYVISVGMPSNRISSKGFGESQIMNRCIDGVRCSAEEHKVNRRVEYAME